MQIDRLGCRPLCTTCRLAVLGMHFRRKSSSVWHLGPVVGTSTIVSDVYIIVSDEEKYHCWEQLATALNVYARKNYALRDEKLANTINIVVSHIFSSSPSRHEEVITTIYAQYYVRVLEICASPHAKSLSGLRRAPDRLLPADLFLRY